MPTHAMNQVVSHLRRAALQQDGAGLTDGELLEQYLARREEAAFEALLRRHGPMVLGVCRRVLCNGADAEDAFQATFLVFVRKAASIRWGRVSNWLYGVAHNTALKAKAMNRKRQIKEREAGTASKHEARAEVWQEVQTLLDAELSKLPDKYRIPIVLCLLEGKTIKEAGRCLGWPQGTVATRLTRGRAQLAKQLTKNGLTISGGALAAGLSQGDALATVPVALIASTTKAATLIAATQQAALAGVVSAKVAALTERMMKTMLLAKLMFVTTLLLALAPFGVGWGVYQIHAAPAPEEPKQVIKTIAAGAPGAAPAVKDEKNLDAEDDKINLPNGHAPAQVLASLDKNGKLVVKTAVMTYRGNGPSGSDLVLPSADSASGPVGAGPTQVKAVTRLRTQTFDLDDVQVLDTKGRKVAKKELAKLLKEETVAMASLGGQPVDPLHLRVLKDGTLTLVLPSSKASGTPNPDIAPPDRLVPRSGPEVPADVRPRK